jgi:hypothetical protein
MPAAPGSSVPFVHQFFDGSPLIEYITFISWLPHLDILPLSDNIDRGIPNAFPTKGEMPLLLLPSSSLGLALSVLLCPSRISL